MGKNTEELTEENYGGESKKSKKKKKKDRITDALDENPVSMDQQPSEDQVVCVEEKQKKKKSKKSKKEKSSDEEKEAVEDSGCEEVAEVKAKKTKKSKKEKTKSDEVGDSPPMVKKEENMANAVQLEVVPPAVGEELDSHDLAKKKKKKSKKNKAVEEEEEPFVTADDANILKKNYPEAPGVLKGSNLLAIPGYGAQK